MEKMTIAEYVSIADEISDDVINYQKNLLLNMMPKERANPDTFYYLTLKLATKVICSLCLDNMSARKMLAENFVEKLPQLVQEAVVSDSSQMSSTKH